MNRMQEIDEDDDDIDAQTVEILVRRQTSIPDMNVVHRLSIDRRETNRDAC